MAEKGQRFQWAKGENQGKLEIYSTNDGEFMEFESGRRCNQSLIGDFILEINEDSDVLVFEDPLAKVVKPKPVVKPGEVAAKVIKETLKSPLIGRSKVADPPSASLHPAAGLRALMKYFAVY